METASFETIQSVKNFCLKYEESLAVSHLGNAAGAISGSSVLIPIP